MAISLVGYSRAVYDGKDLQFEEQLEYIRYVRYIQDRQAELRVRQALRKIFRNGSGLTI